MAPFVSCRQQRSSRYQGFASCLLLALLVPHSLSSQGSGPQPSSPPPAFPLTSLHRRLPRAHTTPAAAAAANATTATSTAAAVPLPLPRAADPTWATEGITGNATALQPPAARELARMRPVFRKKPSSKKPSAKKPSNKGGTQRTKAPGSEPSTTTGVLLRKNGPRRPLKRPGTISGSGPSHSGTRYRPKLHGAGAFKNYGGLMGVSSSRYSWSLHSFEPSPLAEAFLKNARQTQKLLLSVVLVGRDDVFGNNKQSTRSAVALRGYLRTIVAEPVMSTLTEFIIVDYNSPSNALGLMTSISNDVKLLGLQALKVGSTPWQKRSQPVTPHPCQDHAAKGLACIHIRAVSVPERLHRRFSYALNMTLLKEVPFYEFPAKNMAAGMAQGEYILSSLFDDMPVNATWRQLARVMEAEAAAGNAFDSLAEGLGIIAMRWDMKAKSMQYMSRKDLPEDYARIPHERAMMKYVMAVSDHDDCITTSQLNQLRQWRPSMELFPAPDPPACDLTTLPRPFAIGDFLVLPRKTMHQLRGFPIYPDTRAFADRVILCRLLAAGGRVKLMQLPASVFHMYHRQRPQEELRYSWSAQEHLDRICDGRDPAMEYNTNLTDWTLHDIIGQMSSENYPTIEEWILVDDPNAATWEDEEEHTLFRNKHSWKPRKRKRTEEGGSELPLTKRYVKPRRIKRREEEGSEVPLPGVP